MPKILFPLGQLATTSGARAACNKDYLLDCMMRHAVGDWGCICAEDKATNNQALRTGGRLMSAYPIDPSLPSAGYGDNTLWVITEADRSVTTCLLPSEY